MLKLLRLKHSIYLVNFVNDELNLILTKTKEQLKTLDSETNNNICSEVKDLQKQLLSASVLEKRQLEKKIKNLLKVKEYEMVSQNNVTRELELAYLYEYIKENYE